MRNFIAAAALGALLACSACQGSGEPLPQPGMAYCKPGKTKIGYEKGKQNEKPEREVTVDRGFFMDLVEVSNEEYAKFVDTTKHAAPKHWEGGKFAQGDAKLPVVNVNWDDAKAYSEWAGKRLPTEVEWEYAARGTEGFLFPWGAEWAAGKANNFEAGKNGAVEVGSFKEGKSPFGTFDQAGNVWEWTSTQTSSGVVIKGGSFAPLEDRPRASLKATLPKDQSKETLGFRCAKDT